MKKCFLIVAVSVFLLSCADTERNNPYDERAYNYIGKSSAEGSSSSVETDDYPSSSSEESHPSSSSVEPSSSSAEPSSSSVAPSSSSSSSSSVPSSSSSGVGSTCSANFKTVKIDTQTWAAENLNCNVEGSKCYGDDSDNCTKYGRLYNWATAMALPPNCNSSSCSNQVQSPHRGICPSGWHIPSDAEWTALTNHVGTTAGTKLKANSDLWNSNGNGTDEFGFSALPGGSGRSDGSFGSVGDVGYWWSATEGNASNAYLRGMYYSYDYVRRDNYNYKSNLFSVRCVQD